jgi:hypothetical protein
VLRVEQRVGVSPSRSCFADTHTAWLVRHYHDDGSCSRGKGGAAHGVPYRTVHVLLLVFYGLGCHSFGAFHVLNCTRFCVFLIKGNKCLFDAVLCFKEQICDAVQVIKALLYWSSVLWSSFYLFLQLQLLFQAQQSRSLIISHSQFRI